MNALCFSLLVAAVVLAQEKPKAKLSETPPAPRAKARELLDNAAEMVAAAQPEVHAAALLHLAYAYESMDRKKAVEFYQQAFASSATLTANERENLQSDIISAVSQVSLTDAIEMLRQMRPASERVVAPIVMRLLEKDRIDEAIELVDGTGSTGAYSFSAVDQILGKLPADDPRRVSVFSSAMSAYSLHSDDRHGGMQREFARLLARHWQEIPRSMAELSLSAIVKSILDRKDDDPLTETIATAKGSVNFHSRTDVELFDIINVVQRLDPKRADEILEKRSELRKAFELFPEGRTSIGNSTTSSTSDTASYERREEMRHRAHAESRAEEAMAALEKDPQKALELARTIPLAPTKARVLGRIANSVSTKDPQTAKELLGHCIAMLDEVKDPADRASTWADVAQAAFHIKDEKQAWEAIDRGIADASELYKADADKDSPNIALREYWPSTQAYRRIVSRATKLFGVDAEPLLLKIRDPDLALFAQIEMGSTLVGTPGRHYSTMSDHDDRKK